MPLAIARCGHQRLGLLDRRRGVRLVAEALLQLVDRRRPLGERVDHAAHHHRRHVLDDVDQHRPVERQMDGAAHPRIVERLLLVVHPGALDDALIEVRRRHALGVLGLARRHRIADAGIVDAVGQDRRAELRRERQRVIELDAVEIGQALVPVLVVLLHHPDFVLDPALALERAGAGNVDDAAQVPLVVVQRLLADDAVPAAGEGRHDEAGRPRLGELEHHGLLVGRGDLARPWRTAASAECMTPSGGLRIRSKVALTSSEVNSAPSWNCTPSRRWKV